MWTTCKKIATIFAIPVLMIGCSSRTEEMDLDWREKLSYNHNSELSYFINSISLGAVTGEANAQILPIRAFSQENFYLALENSLNSIDLLNKNGRGRYILESEIKEVHRPYAGLDRIAEVTVHYSLVDAIDSIIIFDKEISSPYYMKIEDNFLPFTWSRAGVEKAVQKNISQLVDDIYLLGEGIRKEAIEKENQMSQQNNDYQDSALFGVDDGLNINDKNQQISNTQISSRNQPAVINDNNDINTNNDALNSNNDVVEIAPSAMGDDPELENAFKVNVYNSPRDREVPDTFENKDMTQSPMKSSITDSQIKNIDTDVKYEQIFTGKYRPATYQETEGIILSEKYGIKTVSPEEVERVVEYTTPSERQLKGELSYRDNALNENNADQNISKHLHSNEMTPVKTFDQINVTNENNLEIKNEIPASTSSANSRLSEINVPPNVTQYNAEKLSDIKDNIQKYNKLPNRELEKQNDLINEVKN